MTVKLGANGQRLADRHKAAATDFAESLRLPVVEAIHGGAKTLQDFADLLNEEGHLSREGARWSPTGIQRLMGRLELRRDFVDAQFAKWGPRSQIPRFSC